MSLGSDFVRQYENLERFRRSIDYKLSCVVSHCGKATAQAICNQFFKEKPCDEISSDYIDYLFDKMVRDERRVEPFFSALNNAIDESRQRKAAE